MINAWNIKIAQEVYRRLFTPEMYLCNVDLTYLYFFVIHLLFTWTNSGCVHGAEKKIVLTAIQLQGVPGRTHKDHLSNA